MKTNRFSSPHSQGPHSYRQYFLFLILKQIVPVRSPPSEVPPKVGQIIYNISFQNGFCIVQDSFPCKESLILLVL